MLREELDYFIKHQDELVSQYNGKVLVIRGQQVLGVYNTPLDAYLDAQSKYDPGSFVIQQCTPGPSAYTANVSLLNLI